MSFENGIQCEEIKTFIVTQLFDLKGDKMLVFILPKTNQRKRVYQFLEQSYAHLPKSGLKSELYKQERLYLIVNCYQCAKEVQMTNYYKGILENNEDEYYVNECQNCGCIVHYEPFCDDNAKYIFGHNIIAVGAYFQNYQKYKDEKADKITEEEFLSILQTISTYRIQAPTYQLHRTKLQEYITEKIKTI
ncbi:MAG: hypothetical protein Sylvanvirus28_5 [Sylvanvirus sp.]|uniref:Uncharacterized protein n=1 Tax=Sylvanvirus sp. TaxID=2487774 RepID=A0A3G5AK91_9VIRU|nr:MAG: hypothetical protein Sylvanvirus28_5 [Sylvanvirus sp.]